MSFRNLFICTSVLLGFSPLLHSQVGINTTNPRTTLEVAGDTYVAGAVGIDELNRVAEIDSIAMLGHNEADFVKELNKNSTGGKAIAYYQEYTLTEMGLGC